MTNSQYLNRNCPVLTQALGIAAMLILPGMALAGEGSIRLWPSALVADDQVVLRDVAELTGFDVAAETALAQTPLGESAPAGGSRVITLDDIRSALSGQSVNLAIVTVKGAAECVVRRPAVSDHPARQAVKGLDPSSEAPGSRGNAGASLRSTIIERINREVLGFGGEADVQFGRSAASALDLSGPEYEFEIHRQPGPPLGLVSLDVRILREGQEVHRATVVANVAMLRDVVVSRGPINKGAAVEESNVTLATRRFTKPEEIGVGRTAEVVGQRARAFIPAGELIRGRDLERVPLVKRGQMVEVVSRVGGITVKTAAKAAGDGGFGESVALHVPGKSRDGLVGRVCGPRRVALDDHGVPPAEGESMLAQGNPR